MIVQAQKKDIAVLLDIDVYMNCCVSNILQQLAIQLLTSISEDAVVMLFRCLDIG